MDDSTTSLYKKHNDGHSDSRPAQAPKKPSADYAEVGRGWGTRGDLRKLNRGDVKAEAEKMKKLSPDNSTSVMMQRWRNESTLDQPYNNIGAVKVQDAGQQSSGLAPSVQYLDPEGQSEGNASG